MSKYKLKIGTVGEKVINTYKEVEEKFTDKFLEKVEGSPSGYSLKTGGMAEKVTHVYKKVEDTVVNGYKKVEDGFVHTFLDEVEELQNTVVEEKSGGYRNEKK